MTQFQDNLSPYISFAEHVDPSNPSAGNQRLFVDTDHILKMVDSSGTVTLFGTGLADPMTSRGDIIIRNASNVTARLAKGSAGQVLTSDGTDVAYATPFGDHSVLTYLDATGASAPGTPASGKARIYAKTDGRIYSKDDAGVEYGPFSSGGGASGPLLYIDTLTHGSKYDDFSGVASWSGTPGGAPSNSAITSEIYDTTCQDLTFTAAAKGLTRAWTGDGTAYLSIYGITNTTPDPPGALGGMIGLCLLDSAGTGIGCSLYNDNGFYQWIVTAYNYAGTGNGTGGLAFMTAQATTWPIVYRIVKTGTSYQASVSFNGGVSWRSPTAQTVAGTTSQVAIIRMFGGGGTNPVLRVGTFNNA